MASRPLAEKRRHDPSFPPLPVAIVIASLLAALAVFLPWLAVSGTGPGGSASATQSGLRFTEGIVSFLSALLILGGAIALSFSKAGSRRMFFFILAGASLGIVGPAIGYLLEAANASSLATQLLKAYGARGSAGAAIGVYLSLLSGISVGVCAVLQALKEHAEPAKSGEVLR